MSDPIVELQRELRAFARERDWEHYHTPQNLAALISSEAGELLAHFRWGEDALALRREEVEEEVADVFLGVLRFADVAGLDLVAASRRKIGQNRRRYPAAQDTSPSRGL